MPEPLPCLMLIPLGTPEQAAEKLGVSVEDVWGTIDEPEAVLGAYNHGLNITLYADRKREGDDWRVLAAVSIADDRDMREMRSGERLR